MNISLQLLRRLQSRARTKSVRRLLWDQLQMYSKMHQAQALST